MDKRPKPSIELDEAQLLQAQALYEEHGKISAIRYVLDTLGVGLAVAKWYVERAAEKGKWEQS